MPRPGLWGGPLGCMWGSRRAKRGHQLGVEALGPVAAPQRHGILLCCGAGGMACRLQDTEVTLVDTREQGSPCRGEIPMALEQVEVGGLLFAPWGGERHPWGQGRGPAAPR